jgi:hypothetical protein
MTTVSVSWPQVRAAAASPVHLFELVEPRERRRSRRACQAHVRDEDRLRAVGDLLGEQDAVGR